MSKGTKLYKNFIDGLVKMSRSCAAANQISTGQVCGADAKTGINEILSKLSDEERSVLAEYVLKAYQAGIYDTLEQLEWLRECKAMTMTVEGEILPAGMFEGIPSDYMGRRENWEWPVGL